MITSEEVAPALAAPKTPRKRGAKRPAKRKLEAKGRKKSQRKQQRSKNGTRRTNKAGLTYHVMSVHIPIKMLAQLDAKLKRATGEEPKTRSAFANWAIEGNL